MVSPPRRWRPHRPGRTRDRLRTRCRLEVILDRLQARHVTAFDLDDTMVELARKRLHHRPVSLSVGDVCDIHQPTASHDTVVDFGIIHHVPHWQLAVAEIARVLRPGGLLLFEEVPRRMLDTWAFRTFTVHPRENRFESDNSPLNWPATACTAPPASNTTFAGSSSSGPPERSDLPPRDHESRPRCPRCTPSSPCSSSRLSGCSTATCEPVFNAIAPATAASASLAHPNGGGPEEPWPPACCCRHRRPIAELLGLQPVPLLDHGPSRVAGIMLAALGVFAAFGAQRAMGSSWRTTVDPTERPPLVTTGIFAIVRNPIYTSINVMVIGLTFAVPNGIALAGVVMIIIGSQLQVRLIEEPYLTATHGQAYRDYCEAVDRFLPGIGRIRRA